jgi:hypothetical protein
MTTHLSRKDVSRPGRRLTPGSRQGGRTGNPTHKPVQQRSMLSRPVDVVNEWLRNLLARPVSSTAWLPRMPPTPHSTPRTASCTRSCPGRAHRPDHSDLQRPRGDVDPLGEPGIQRDGNGRLAGNVGVFGDFRYTSLSLGKVVSSPLSILVKVADGKVTDLRFLEDSSVTASGFRRNGAWIFETEPGAEPFRD